MSGYVIHVRKMVELFANSGDPYQMPHSAASDLGLHCLPITLLVVSRLQWVTLKGTLNTILSLVLFQGTNLGGSVGCAVRLETRRSRVQPPPRSATFFRGD